MAPKHLSSLKYPKWIVTLQSLNDQWVLTDISEELETAVDKLKLIPLTVHLANSCFLLFWGGICKFYRNGACSVSGSNNGLVLERDPKFWSNWAHWYDSDRDIFFLVSEHLVVFYDLFSEYQKRKALSQGI